MQIKEIFYVLRDYRHYGPFESYAEAQDWGDAHFLSEHWRVVTLYCVDPKEVE